MSISINSENAEYFLFLFPEILCGRFCDLMYFFSDLSFLFLWAAYVLYCPRLVAGFSR